jgi:hypothetical protein
LEIRVLWNGSGLIDGVSLVLCTRYWCEISSIDVQRQSLGLSLMLVYIVSRGRRGHYIGISSGIDIVVPLKYERRITVLACAYTYPHQDQI